MGENMRRRIGSAFSSVISKYLTMFKGIKRYLRKLKKKNKKQSKPNENFKLEERAFAHKEKLRIKQKPSQTAAQSTKSFKTQHKKKETGTKHDTKMKNTGPESQTYEPRSTGITSQKVVSGSPHYSGDAPVRG